MKYALLLAVLPFCALADVEIERTAAANMKSYTVNEYIPKAHTLIGQLVKIKFSARSADISPGKDGSSCTIFNETNSTKRNIDPYYASISVIVPEEGIPWFTKVKVNDWESRSSYVAICRIEKGEVSGTKVTMIGREIKTDIRGSRVVW